MTQTLKRELRLKFNEVLIDYPLIRELLADRLADAALEVAGLAKKQLRGIEAAIMGDRPVTEDDLIRADPIEDTLAELEQGLHRNIPRTGLWQDLAKWINKRPAQTIKKWVSWYMNDKFRVENAWRLKPDDVRSAWPQAFPKPPDPKTYYVEKEDPEHPWVVIPKKGTEK